MIIVFDVCGTLYNSNTTFDFIEHFLASKSRKTILTNKILRKILAVFSYIYGEDLARKLIIRKLSGVSKFDLEKSAKSFVKTVLAHKKIDLVHKILIEQNNQVNEIVLCSASLDVIVNEIANELNVKKHYASELEVSSKDKTYTGRLKSDLQGKKSLLFKEIDWVLTDNKDDLDIISISKKSTIVSFKKDIKFWLGRKINVSILK